MQQGKNLDLLLKDLNPSASDCSFVFCTVPGMPEGSELAALDPWAVIKEAEGITLILEKERADAFGLTYESIFGRITLQVYSSLDAVGLSAAVATTLANAGISANIVAAYHHDHLFVLKTHIETALNALRGIQCS